MNTKARMHFGYKLSLLSQLGVLSEVPTSIDGLRTVDWHAEPVAVAPRLFEHSFG